MNTITVDIPNSSKYDILIGHDVLGSIGQQLKKQNIGDKIFITTSPRIGSYYLKPLLKSLKAAGFKDIKVDEIPDGEKHKNQKSYLKLSRSLLAFDQNNNKKVFVINLGGGVVGDVSGFVAATYNRGTDYVQIPTTLLAFVDCGIGGKLGINLDSTKNIIGAIRQPALVYGDLNVLKTLNKREMRSGMAEVVKYGVIGSPCLFELVENNINNIFTLCPNIINKIVMECYTTKVKIVVQDEFDKKDIRVVLNYGHTIGHAIEAASQYAYRHGEAVSIGMVCANDIAVKLGLLNKDVSARIENLLTKIGLPVSIKNCHIDDIMKHFWRDKKFVNKENKLILATGIGATKIKTGVPEGIIKSVIKNRYAQ